MARLEPSRRARRVVARSGLALGLLSCARFGFERLPADDLGIDASLGPVTSLDGGVGWAGGAGGAQDRDASAPSGGASGGGAGGAGWGSAGAGGDGAGDEDAGTGGSSGDGGAGAAGSGGAGGSSGSAGSGGSGGAGGAGPALGCSQFSAFGAPVRVGGLSSNNLGPALSDDGLTLLFVDGPPPFDVFTATRPNLSSTSFGNVSALSAVNASGSDATPFLADGGLTLLLASDRPANDGLNQLMLATRASTSDAFGAVTPIANVNSNAIELSPQLSLDGLRLYFSSDRSNGNRDIYVASRASRADNFGAPARVSGLNTQNDEFGPSLRDDELEVFIASDRGGSASMDIWHAVRDSIDDPFGQPVNLEVVNSSGYETDPRLSRDGTELFFASSQGASGPNLLVLWVARRSCLDP